MMNDRQLLDQYFRTHSESAFSELVARNVDLVYSAALRLVGGDTHLAEDVTQTVFVDMVRKAGSLPGNGVLAGWLHQHACFTASKAVRTERRRQAREQTAMEMSALDHHNEPSWESIAPHLDESLNQLDAKDRDAIVLRFFKQQDLRAVGAALGISDDAAQKRVSRALDKLREQFSRRGITTSAAALSVVLTANAVQAAPVGLAVTISTAAALGGTSIAATATATAIKTIAMTTLQKTIVTATVAVLAGVGIFEARQAAKLREQNQTLQQQQAALAERMTQLSQALAAATNQVAALRANGEQADRIPRELLRLRGEVGVLRREVVEAGKAKSRPAQPPLSTAREYCERGRRHFVDGESEDALDDFTKALELNPNDINALRFRSGIYAMGENAKAVADLSRILELKPKDGGARYDRAWNYAHLKQFDQAIADYTTCLEGDTDLSEARFNNNESRNTKLAYVLQARGRAYQEGKADYARAIADYTAALQLDPESKGVHRLRGQCYEALGETAKAQQDFSVEKP